MGKGNGGKASKAMCLSEEDGKNMMKICHAGSALGEKAEAAMEACAIKAESRAKKGKGKKPNKGKGKGNQPSALNLMRLCNGLKRNMQEKSAFSLKWDGWT